MLCLQGSGLNLNCFQGSKLEEISIMDIISLQSSRLDKICLWVINVRGICFQDS